LKICAVDLQFLQKPRASTAPFGALARSGPAATHS
jgi:hypothetical protein